MNYLSLLKAHGKSGKVPTMARLQWSEEQRARISQGWCVQCGERPADQNSYLCTECQAGETIESIRSEIDALRDRLLHQK